jgi:hypothetical protein
MGKHEKTKVIEERLQFLYSQYGELTPEMVVKDAKNPKSPLHAGAGFEWNVSKAAYNNWLENARRLIASVTVIHRTEKFTYTAPVYIRDPRKQSNTQGYVSVEDCLNDANLAREAIELEIEQCFARLHRLRDLAKALGQEKRVDKVFNELKQFQVSLAA